MMLLPVFERFAEFGWQPFVEPAETYEFFSVSGVFRRANVDASLRVVQSGAQHLVQRSALFDVCLKSGLAHLVVAYVRAEEQHSALQPAEKSFTGVKDYVLKEPIAVQQWARRRLEAIEQAVNEMVAEQQYSDSPGDTTSEALEEEIRQLNGLRMILIALTERLKDGSRHAAQRSRAGMEDPLDETELMRLTTAGIQNLLELIARTQSVICACNCMLWLGENRVVVDSAVYDGFYSQARTLRVTYREQFEDIYGSNLSSVSGLSEPMLLIEHVMKSASVVVDDLGGSVPPTQLGQLLQLLRTASIQEDVVQFYGDEIDREPVEGYFRVQVALLLYFCLDRAYLSEVKAHVHNGVRIAHKMRALADSLAAQLSVRDDMKLTLLALWLVENAVVVKTSGEDQVAAIYENAVGLLQQSSAMHLHQKYDLEADLILHLLETLVHRGESLVAWKVWNTFGVELEQSPPAATELIVVISLELDLWERALSLLRSQNRPDLLDLVFNWLMKSHRLKELVQGVTLLPAEEKLFHAYMMESNVETDEDVLRDDNIKRVDLLVMYYILRNKYEQAWGVHHEHLAMIRACTSGDTQVAMAVLNQPSFRIREALLGNMCSEPNIKPYTHKSRNADVSMDDGQRRQSSRPALLDNEEMEDVSTRVETGAAAVKTGQPKVTTMQETTAVMRNASGILGPQDATQSHDMPGSSSFDYSPGIFSSRAAQPQSSSAPRSGESPADASPADEMTPAPAKGKNVSIGSVESSPDLGLHAITRPKPIDTAMATSARGTTRQALDFGSSPVSARSRQSSESSTPVQLVAPFGDRRALGTPPIRSKINPSFASSSVPPPPPTAGASTDDFSLKPRSINSLAGESVPMDVQVDTLRAEVPENRTVQQATTPTTPVTQTDSDATVLQTPKRFQFVREPMTDSRLETTRSHELPPASPASAELEGMELERIDEEFSTPMSRSRGRRTDPASPASAPVRRNPRRSARNKY